MRFPAYPNYKPSGVEWLGEVPEHWEVWKLRHVCRFAYGDSLASEDRAEGEVPVYGSNGPVGSHIVPNTERPVIIIGRKGSHGKVNFSAVPIFAIDTTYIIDYRHTSSDLRWLFHTLSALKLDAISKDSAVPGLAREDAYAYSAPSPTLFDQRAIADFLDRETTKIDTLVAKKRTLIERLKEKRTALISRTVTRGLPPDAARQVGLDPHPKLKPSGIDWLGEVPEHWEIVQLRRRCVIVDCMHRTVSFIDDGVPLASIREVHGFELNLSNAKETTEEEYFGLIDGGRKPGVGDIIYSRNATVGEASIVATTERFAMGQDVCLLRSVGGSPKHLLYLLCASPLIQQLESFMVGATFGRINVGQIKTFWVCWPSAAEQRAIADFLDRETAKIDTLVGKVETAIERLQEYRTALITAAVTGKIDVRDGAVPEEDAT